jgi:hypothetical protein
MFNEKTKKLLTIAAVAAAVLIAFFKIDALRKFLTGS